VACHFWITTKIFVVVTVVISQYIVFNMLPFFTNEAKAVKDKTTPSSSLHVPSSKEGNTISPSSPPIQSNGSLSGCINYDPSTRTITVSCSSARLTDIDNKLHDGSILTKQSPNGVWFLNANLVIAKGATLHIDSTDTKWLKIGSSGATSDAPSSVPANSIDVHGSLKIDSIKITSWNPATNNYAITNGSRQEAPVGSKGVTANGYIIHLGAPRAFIKIESDATGTTDITNSEIAYLGYESGSTSGFGTGGLHYFGGDGSILRGNKIHDFYFGLYSRGVGHMIIENNEVYHNTNYGLDPHTGSHDMIIRNNVVYGNGEEGVICSLNCYNIVIENNKVYHNQKSGIMLSRNVYNSLVRNNNVSDEVIGIHVSQSHDNQIFNNTISGSMNAIDVHGGSSNNRIYDNTIIKSARGISVSSGDAAANTIYSNIIK
jgi:parallel beta-helix repeat protein